MTVTVAELQAVFSANTAGFDAGMRGVQSGLSRAGSDLQSFGTKLTKLTLPLAVAGGFAMKAAIDWESAFAGVKKTVSATDDQLSSLEKGLRVLATSAASPVSSLAKAHITLAGVAEAAGQLGVETPYILKFTEQMAILGMTTDMTAENAAFMLAQFANISGMDMNDIDRLAAVIVELGNNSATTESAIVEMGQRLAGIMGPAGFSADEIMGYAADMSSLGINPEAGGTAMTTIVGDIIVAVAKGGDALDDFAETAGLSAKEFADAWETNPSEALRLFINGLGKLDDKQKELKLEEMGLDGARIADVLRRMSNNTSLLNNSLTLGKEAWDKNTAQWKEAGNRAATAASKINVLRNNTNELGITMGNVLLPPLVEVTNKLTPFVAGLAESSPETLQLAAALLAVGIVAGPVATVIGGLGTVLGALSLPVLALAGLFYIGATTTGAFGNALEKIIDSAEQKDYLGVIGGIGEALVAIPYSITTWLGAQVGIDVPEGMAAWRDVLKTGAEIIDHLPGAIQGWINKLGEFSIPQAWTDFKGLISDIWNFFTGLPNEIGKFFGVMTSFDLPDWVKQLGGIVGGGGGGGSSSGAVTVTATGTAGSWENTPPHQWTAQQRADYEASKKKAGTGALMHDFVGAASANTPYLIGTGAQPELFVPGSSGMMYPAGSYGGGIDLRGAQIILPGVKDPAEFFDEMEREAKRRNMRLGVSA
jgi:TP901 family phage tail tape measure protein